MIKLSSFKLGTKQLFFRPVVYSFLNVGDFILNRNGIVPTSAGRFSLKRKWEGLADIVINQAVTLGEDSEGFYIADTQNNFPLKTSLSTDITNIKPGEGLWNKLSSLVGRSVYFDGIYYQKKDILMVGSVREKENHKVVVTPYELDVDEGTGFS